MRVSSTFRGAQYWLTGTLVGLSPHGLSYIDHDMFSAASAMPVDTVTEARLMAFYVQSPERHFDVTDRQMVRTLHERYTAMPHSLSPEQLALVYACLCRSSQLHGEAMVGIGAHYYRLARNKLQEWGRASLMSIGAWPSRSLPSLEVIHTSSPRFEPLCPSISLP